MRPNAGYLYDPAHRAGCQEIGNGSTYDQLAAVDDHARGLPAGAEHRLLPITREVVGHLRRGAVGRDISLGAIQPGIEVRPSRTLSANGQLVVELGRAHSADAGRHRSARTPCLP